MKPSDRRAAMKAEMAARTQESYASKDDSGKFKSIFIKEKLGNIQRWKCGEDEHFLNIIPFIAGKNHPTVKEGKPAYYLDVFVHNKVGAKEDSFICMSRTFNKPCAICDHQNEIRKQDNYNNDYVKSLNPGRRAIYNIQCLDSDKEIAKKVQLWDASHFSIEKNISEIAKLPRNGGFVTFADPDDGKTIMFRRTGTGQNNTKYTAFQFMARTEPISDELLDLALTLDECIYIPTYDEVKQAFFGSDEVDEETADEVAERSEPRSETKVTKEAEKVAESTEFVCPGNAPDDFGTFAICDACPDQAECELEFNKMEEEKAEAERQRIAAEKEKSTTAPSGLAARRLAAQAAQGTTAPVKEDKPVEAPVDNSGEPVRRIRHRPGQ